MVEMVRFLKNELMYLTKFSSQAVMRLKASFLSDHFTSIRFIVSLIIPFEISEVLTHQEGKQEHREGFPFELWE